MKYTPFCFLLSLAFCTGTFAQQEPDDSLAASAPTAKASEVNSGSLEKVIDSFLRAYSSDKIEWRMNVKLGVATESSVPPEGYEKGKAEIGGWYYYQPKTCALLTSDQRREVMRDKRFAPFLGQMRALADGNLPGPSAALVEASKAPAQPLSPKVIGRSEMMAKLLAQRQMPPSPISFEISPEELVMPGPIVMTAHSYLAP